MQFYNFLKICIHTLVRMYFGSEQDMYFLCNARCLNILFYVRKIKLHFIFTCIFYLFYKKVIHASYPNLSFTFQILCTIRMDKAYAPPPSTFLHILLEKVRHTPNRLPPSFTFCFSFQTLLKGVRHRPYPLFQCLCFQC